MRIVIVVLVAILVGIPSQAIGGKRIAGNWFDAESHSRYRFQTNGDFSFGLTLPPNSLYHGAYRLGNCGNKRPGNLTLLWENGVEVCYSAQLRGTRLHLVYKEQRLLSGSWGIPEDCKLGFQGNLPPLRFGCRNFMLVRY
jgi:hypothetical protein